MIFSNEHKFLGTIGKIISWKKNNYIYTEVSRLSFLHGYCQFSGGFKLSDDFILVCPD